jgi:uncharacterized cupredoxin-like copper-binding protein
MVARMTGRHGRGTGSAGGPVASGSGQRSSRRAILVGGAAAVALATVSTVVVAGAHGRSGSGPCTVPALPGSVVQVVAVDMGRMIGGGMMGGNPLGMTTMRLFPTPTRVRAGTVSFLLRNAGSSSHELLVLPLAIGASAGARAVGADGRVSEDRSLGEASRSCGAGAGSGVRAGSAGWVTLTLGPGRYEVLCNVKDHYADGMWAELSVS